MPYIIQRYTASLCLLPYVTENRSDKGARKGSAASPKDDARRFRLGLGRAESGENREDYEKCLCRAGAQSTQPKISDI